MKINQTSLKRGTSIQQPKFFLEKFTTPHISLGIGYTFISVKRKQSWWPLNTMTSLRLHCDKVLTQFWQRFDTFDKVLLWRKEESLKFFKCLLFYFYLVYGMWNRVYSSHTFSLFSQTPLFKANPFSLIFFRNLGIFFLWTNKPTGCIS